MSVHLFIPFKHSAMRRPILRKGVWRLPLRLPLADRRGRLSLL
ncbi:hypothetical protein HMPREF0973_01539 [Prevotella veroralis F0319]|uniref:Uncharacterized protein n=1 Tax=Prevotella veroralis F0319 TaxID=649761 RepID=C9MPJ8_9BACT|nr:hypothetical protein HMPREF0973_01539 [Prevotella veroralis F0319]